MLLPRTLQLESSTIHDGVINDVVDSDNPMKDFQLPGRYVYQLSAFEQIQIMEKVRKFYESLQDASAA